MTYSEIMQAIKAIPGATMARANKSNFVAIPTENEGVVKVNVSTALSIDTKTHKAFNYEAAVSEYKAWEAESALRAAERAAKPAKPKGPNPEAQARRDELDKRIGDMPNFTDLSASEIHNALGKDYTEGTPKVTPMAVGQSAIRLVEKGVLTVRVDETTKKKYYSKA